MNIAYSSKARFERKSTNSWITICLDDLDEFNFPTEMVTKLDINGWFYVGQQLLPDFELVTIGDDIE